MKLLFQIFISCLAFSTLSGQPSLPSGCFVLHSKDLQVQVDRKSGLPYQYLYKGARIWGVDSAHKISAIIGSIQPHAYDTLTILPASIHIKEREADLLFNIVHHGQMAASFHLKYILSGASLVITMEEVQERKGFELIGTSLPDLATVREEDGSCWLAHGMDGGAVVNLKQAHNFQLPDDDNFGRIGYVIPMAIVGTGQAECIMEVSTFMDATEIEIVGKEKSHHARIGTRQAYRVHGGGSYGMNDGGDAVKGNENTPNLLIGQTPRCRLDFAADLDGNGSVDWLDGAKLLAKRMPAPPTSYFNDKFIYLVGGKYKPEKQPRTTFAQSEQLIKDIAMLTDYAPQIPLVSGWVYDGQDTGFPSEDSVNATLGGYEGLIHLMQKGPQYHANVSVNTNYDDAYKSSPLFDTAFIARRPDGRVWKARDWAGDTSYVVGMARYMESWGMPRIDYMMNHYPIHDAILIDAMSWFAIRNDWNPLYPASGYKNLVDGKFRIIDEFGKRGVQVMSEQLRYPFVGKLAVSADGSGGGDCPFGGHPIPFLAAIYRKSAIWGAGDFNLKEVKKNFFWNCRPMPWYVNASDRNAIADYYYMTVLPYNKIHNRSIEQYEEDGFRCRIGLEGGGRIEIDWMNDDYSVRLDGREIAGHDATFCPIDQDRIACYARNTTQLSIDLPAGWDPGKLAGRALFVDHRESVAVSMQNGKILVPVIAGRPVILYRNGSIADKTHL